MSFTFIWMLFLLRAYKAISHLKSLDSFAIPILNPLPRISIVIAVKDDESEIEETIKALLNSNYSDLELVVVNDRSRDRTGEILNAYSKVDKRLKIIHLKELPIGWLGKVHAIHQGVKIASGDFLLFMDADMSADVKILEKSVAVMQSEKLDHLAILPNVVQKSYYLDLLMATSNILFTTSAKPWMSIEERPQHSVKGVGKFNLVRKSSFLKTKGFEWLKMEVADDVALGQLMAQNEGRSLFIKAGISGPNLNWYPTFWHMVLGLEKNIVGGFTNYKWSIFLTMILISFCPFLIPLCAFLTLETWPIFWGLVSVMISFIFALKAKSVIHYPWKVLAAFPFGIFILALVLVRSFLICQKNGGIKWSATLYPLKDLKSGCRVRLGL